MSISSSFIVYKILKSEIKNQPKVYSASETYNKSEIDSKLLKTNDSAKNFADQLYFKNKQGRFKSSEIAANVELSCDNNDIILSGTCLGLPYAGGDTIAIGSNMGTSKPPHKLVDWFSCGGAVYNLSGDYSVNANVVCLKRD